jgi:hypothetical protein
MELDTTAIGDNEETLAHVAMLDTATASEVMMDLTFAFFVIRQIYGIREKIKLQKLGFNKRAQLVLDVINCKLLFEFDHSLKLCCRSGFVQSRA